MATREKLEAHKYLQPEQFPDGKHPDLFKHLPIGSASVTSLFKFIERAADKDADSRMTRNIVLSSKDKIEYTLPQQFLELGMGYATGNISGTWNRCHAFIEALKNLFENENHIEPQDELLQKYLFGYLEEIKRFLAGCRQLPLALENIINHCSDIISQAQRATASQTENNIEDETKKAIALIYDALCQYSDDMYTHHNNTVASVEEHMKDGDVILIYGHSDVIYEGLLAAKDNGKVIKIVVIDSKPTLDGKRMAHALTAHGFDVDYALITSLQYVMPNVTKVFLGASAIFFNGAMYSRSGTTLVALTAKRCNKPTLVCAEPFKFIDRIYLDGISHNELGKPANILLSPEQQHSQREVLFSSLQNGIKYGNPYVKDEEKYKKLSQIQTESDDIQLSRADHLASQIAINESAVTPEKYAANKQLKLLHVCYDITPPTCISAIITSGTIIPPSSASLFVTKGLKKSGGKSKD